MFRLPSINVKEDIFFKFTLMRNRREKLMDIPLKCVSKLSRQLEDIDSFELNIEQYITVKDIQKLNPLYLKIQPKQQIIVESYNKKGELINKERFIINEKSRSKSKSKGNKSFKCYSFENTLKDKRYSFENSVLQLQKNDVVINDGVLDIFAKNTGFSIGYVDPKSKVETIRAMETVINNLFTNFTNNKVGEESLIWEKSVTTTIGKDKPLYLHINYQGLKTYDGNGLLLKTENISNTILEPLHDNITKISCYHHSETNNRYGIRYVFLLADGQSVERICTFTNVINKKITSDSIDLIWETGNVVEKEHVKIINVTNSGTWWDLITDFMHQFNSVAIFDTYNKIINVYSKDNLGKTAPLTLSLDTNIVDVSVTENSNYPNSLQIVSQNNISIASENIFGTDIIYDFSQYINKKIFSDELILNWNRYLKVLEVLQEQWYTTNNNRYSINQKKITMDSKVKSLTDRIKYTKNLLSGYVASGDTVNQEKVKLEIDQLTASLNECLASVKTLQSQLDEIDNILNGLINQTRRENATDNKGKIFTQDDIDELNDCEVLETYEDSNFTTPYGLLEEGKKRLSELVIPQLDFQLNTKNLIQMIKRDWTNVLTLGDKFQIDGDKELIEELGGESEIRLVGYNIEPNVNKVSDFVFTNKMKKYDIKSGISSVGKQVASASGNIRSFKDVWEDSKLSNNFVGDLITNGLDLYAQQVRGKSNRNFITIDNTGIMLEDTLDRNKSLYISSGLICLSTDGFKSSRVAISPDGVLAETIIGKLIIGEHLIIGTELGDFTIGNVENSPTKAFGMQIKEQNFERIFIGTELVNGVRKAVFRLVGKDGGLNLSEDGILSEIQFNNDSNVDVNAPLPIKARLRNNVSSIKDGLLTINLLPFRVHSKGVASGGQVATGFTSNSGGGASSGGGGGYYKSENKTSTAQQTPNGNYPSNLVGGTSEGLAYSGEALSSKYHYHEVWLSLEHWHTTNVTVNIPNHTHWCYDHTHYTSVNIPSHTHEESKGCYDIANTKPSNVRVVVNGTTVRSGINNDTEIDIGAYLLKDRINEIYLYSDTLGSIQTNLSIQYFKQW